MNIYWIGLTVIFHKSMPIIDEETNNSGAYAKGIEGIGSSRVKYANGQRMPGTDASLLAYRAVFDEMGARSSSHRGGRMLSTVSPDTGTTTYVHDAAGNLVSKTDANGVIVTYVYDALNRLTSMNFPAHGEQFA